MFVSLKPWFICQLKEWNICCCHYHQEIWELLHGFNDMRVYEKGLHGKGQLCQCSCKEICAIPLHTCSLPVKLDSGPFLCSSHILTYMEVTEFWQSLLCPIEIASLWFKKNCLLEKCNLCGVIFLKLCFVELESDAIISQRCISYMIVGKNEDEQDKKSTIGGFQRNPCQGSHFLLESEISRVHYP